jgi:hypothetical protein
MSWISFAKLFACMAVSGKWQARVFVSSETTGATVNIGVGFQINSKKFQTF